jgi:hypothetical protein
LRQHPLLHENLERPSDPADGLWRLETEALRELGVRRRAADSGLIYESPAEVLFQHTSLTVPLARRVASVAASILPADVHDQRFRALCLDFKGGDEGVFSLDDDVLRFALQLQSDGELQLDTPGSFQSTTVAPRPQLN